MAQSSLARRAFYRIFLPAMGLVVAGGTFAAKLADTQFESAAPALARIPDEAAAQVAEYALQARARSLAADIEHYMAERIGDLGDFARALSAGVPGDLGNARAALETLHASGTYWRALAVVNPNGAMVASRGEGFTETPTPPAGVLSLGVSHVDPVAHFLGGETAIEVWVPIRAQGRTIAGAVGGMLTLNGLDDALQRAGAGLPAAIEVVGADARAVLSQGSAIEPGSVVPDEHVLALPEGATRMHGYGIGRDGSWHDAEGLGAYARTAGTEWFFDSSRRFDGADWVVSIRMPRAAAIGALGTLGEIEEEIGKIQDRLVLVIGGVVGLSLLVLLAVTLVHVRETRAPFQRLRGLTNAYAEGRLEVAAAGARSAEEGALVEALERLRVIHARALLWIREHDGRRRIERG